MLMRIDPEPPFSWWLRAMAALREGDRLACRHGEAAAHEVVPEVDDEQGVVESGSKRRHRRQVVGAAPATGAAAP